MADRDGRSSDSGHDWQLFFPRSTNDSVPGYRRREGPSGDRPTTRPTAMTGGVLRGAIAAREDTLIPRHIHSARPPLHPTASDMHEPEVSCRGARASTPWGASRPAFAPRTGRLRPLGPQINQCNPIQAALAGPCPGRHSAPFGPGAWRPRLSADPPSRRPFRTRCRAASPLSRSAPRASSRPAMPAR
jgi:hypothetical protein